MAYDSINIWQFVNQLQNALLSFTKLIYNFMFTPLRDNLDWMNAITGNLGNFKIFGFNLTQILFPFTNFAFAQLSPFEILSSGGLLLLLGLVILKKITPLF